MEINLNNPDHAYRRQRREYLGEDKAALRPRASGQSANSRIVQTRCRSW